MPRHFTIKTKLIATLCVPLLIMAAFFIFSLTATEKSVLEKEKSNVKIQLAAVLDEKLKGQVDTITYSISSFYQHASLEYIKKNLTVEMTEFKSTIKRIYKDSFSDEEAEESIYAFLNMHRWNGGRYFFAYDANSFISKASGSDLSTIGKNGYNKQDANGRYFVRLVVSSAKENEIGFSEYAFLNPITQKTEDKITAAFYFKPLNIVIASGEYISTLKKENVQAALHAVTIAKYGKNGYFWVQDEDGTILAHPKSGIIGTQLPNTKQIAKNIKGKIETTTFTRYENPLTKKFENKIIYTRNIFPEWGWTIGTGAYESDIIAVQDSLTEVTQNIFEEEISSVIATSFILITLSFIIVIWIITAIVKKLLLLKERIDILSTGEADLTSRLDITSNDELGNIIHSVNNFIIYLQSMMLDISQASSYITENTEQLKRQSKQVNDALITHAIETEQVVSAITEMSSTSETVAQSATETAINTQKANDEAVLSKSIVTQASDSVIALVDEVDSASVSINTMNENTQQIIKVLSVIGDIADQTNLLALNAAIEAARAGEQGRGFAVVADEVRSLAARTQASTAEINTILDTLSSDTSNAVAAMDITRKSCQRTAENTTRVNGSLDTMTDFIVEINDLSTQIATASEEQSAVSEEVSRNMNNISQMVKELTASGQTTVDSTQNLSSANAQLDALVDKFKLK